MKCKAQNPTRRCQHQNLRVDPTLRPAPCLPQAADGTRAAPAAGTTNPPRPHPLHPAPQNLGVHHTDVDLLHERRRGRAAAPGFGGSCRVPGDLRRKKGARSQAPWQAALIRANDCRAPLPRRSINAPINSSRARSARRGGFAGRGSPGGLGEGKNPPGVGGGWAARLRSRRVGTARCPRVYLAQQPQ